ncbi:hypothetical protein PsorP6_010005 [Peronosclerospora sorghi]|uniref:Uncharacterized protein n=1 Tax=Peronosclerospora sorghi TaxID=230839 RepID=A0ACC0VW62_9STRA|nr:hypothetical protein PsorP6_010005 [Peronosclerospora sorghi]
MFPFRESKLARLFKANLVGDDQGPLVMIIAVNPPRHDFDDTLRTLKYSAVSRELVRSRTSIQIKAASTTMFDDLDGRLKKRRRQSTKESVAQLTNHLASSPRTNVASPLTIGKRKEQKVKRNKERCAQAKASKLQMEFRIREKVVEKVREQWLQFRAEYHSGESRNREDRPSAQKKCKRQHA